MMRRAAIFLTALAAFTGSVQAQPVDGARAEACDQTPLWRFGEVTASAALEARLRVEMGEATLAARPSEAANVAAWARVMPSIDVRAPHTRAFLQLVATDTTGIAAPGAADTTGADVLQAFVEASTPQRNGGGRGVTVRAGRALMPLGSERLIGARSGANVPQPFDGVRVITDRGPMQITVFAGGPTAIGADDFDDRRSRFKSLGGVYATLRLSETDGLDVYRLRFLNDRAVFAQGMGVEKRDTYGVRVFGARSRLAWNWEAMAQTGRFGGRNIGAWSVATETSLLLTTGSRRPRLRLRANLASGDADAADGTLGTFDPMFPRAKYFGELSLVGPYNIANIRADVELSPARDITLGFALGPYWRAQRADGVYDIAGRLVRAPGAAQSRFVGAQIEALAIWRVDPTVSLAASASVFRPGAFLRETGSSPPVTLIAIETGYRF